MDERIIIATDRFAPGKRLGRRLWGHFWTSISVLAVLISLLVDVGGALSRITEMIPQALAILGALLPVLIVGGIVVGGSWVVATVFDVIADRKRARWRKLRAVVEPGFAKLRAACEPETVDQDDRNVVRLKADARDYVNQVLPLVTGDHPGECTTDDESLRRWYAIFAQLRMDSRLARLAVMQNVESDQS
ncbi:MAG: hypothetical protein OXH08_14630 [Gammaproteobacteria bacterium]|nr:hypothetical protein [Gammaproteobacteria bacterium]